VVYYPDTGVSLEAFKAGQFDFIRNMRENWATGYESAVRDGRNIKEEISQLNTGYAGLRVQYTRLIADAECARPVSCCLLLMVNSRFQMPIPVPTFFFGNSELGATAHPAKRAGAAGAWRDRCRGSIRPATRHQ